MKKSREEIYRIIDKERDYQDERWADFDDANNSHADWLIYIEVHLSKAKAALYNSHDLEKYSNAMRAIAALAVACGERHGMLNRVTKTK
jgi:hypothetical protein